MAARKTTTSKTTPQKEEETPTLPVPVIPVIKARCQCHTHYTGKTTVDDPENPTAEFPVFEPCTAETSRTYAPGHDARLKSLLLKLHRAGQEYHYEQGGLLVTAVPVLVLLERGWIKDRSEADARVRKPKAKTETTEDAEAA